jgi:tRNA modification GTPase
MLAGADRAIVTPIAGTTRDLVSEDIDIEGLAVTLVDTAGWHETIDLVEREGVARSEQARAVADLLLLVVDSSEPPTAEDDQLLAQTVDRPRIVIANKSDLPAPVATRAVVGAGFSPLVCMSAKTGEGHDELRRAMAQALADSDPLRDSPAISNIRHIDLLDQARASLVAAQMAAAGEGTPEEFLLADLQQARARLEEVVGVRTSDDVLQHIFERFCVGK